MLPLSRRRAINRMHVRCYVLDPGRGDVAAAQLAVNRAIDGRHFANWLSGFGKHGGEKTV